MRRATLSLSLLLAAAACADAPALLAPAGEGSAVGIQSVACVTFDGIPSGTPWGAWAGHAPNTLVHVENGIGVRVREFDSGGGLLYGNALVDVPSPGNLNAAHTWRVNLAFDVTRVGFRVNHVRFLYQDGGPTENLKVNGALYVGDIASAPAVLGGATVTVTGGSVTLSGPIQTVEVGGDTFAVDSFCAIN
jgi:hypothetical protein